jgi:hypothetical protein
VYYNFFNDIWNTNHIEFYKQTHIVIDKVVNGDIPFDDKSDLTNVFVKVERVVDVV